MNKRGLIIMFLQLIVCCKVWRLMVAIHGVCIQQLSATLMPLLKLMLAKLIDFGPTQRQRISPLLIASNGLRVAFLDQFAHGCYVLKFWSFDNCWFGTSS